MEALEAILTRRSIRRFTGEPVPDPLLEAILAAAMSAPSSKNQQARHFVVITDRDILREVPSFHPFASAATQNILLAAHANGLGAVWLGVYPLEERVAGFRRLTGLPDTVVPLSLVPMGFPAVHKPRVDRFDRTRLHKDRWQGGER